MRQHHLGRLVVALRPILGVKPGDMGIVIFVDDFLPISGHPRPDAIYTLLFSRDGSPYRVEVQTLGESFDFAD